jgi:PIN domain nuclease of toxin-antitoxin system
VGQFPSRNALMALVLDTHAVVRYLSASDQLSPTARAVIETAEQNGDDVFISAISLVEIIYLAERGRVPSPAVQRLEDFLGETGGSMVVAPLDAAVAEAVKRIPRATVPEMPDRIIAATAVHLKAALVTRDRRLQAAVNLQSLGIRIVW